MRSEWAGVKNLAWIRSGALGDLLVGMAALVESAELFPSAAITVVGPRLWVSLLSPATYPYVRSIVAVERRSSSGEVFEVRNGEWVSVYKSTSLIRILKTCDAVVNFNIDSYRYGFSSLLAGVEIRIGSAPAPFGYLYTHASPFFGKDPMVHERDAPLLMLEYAETGWRRGTRSTEENRRRLAGLLAESRLVKKWRGRGLPPAKEPDAARATAITGNKFDSYVLINPTSSRRTNTWPPEKFHQFLLANRSRLEAEGLEAIVIGAPNETEWLKDIARDEFKIVQTQGLDELADVLACARGLVTNTSSMQFLAASMGTPTITIMGRARPEIWGPLGPHDLMVRGTPSPELRHDIFLQEQEAYRSVEVESVSRALYDLIEIRKREIPR